MNPFILLAVAGILGSILTPLVIKLAYKYSFLDKPNARKVHKTPKPCLGGVAIFLAVSLTALILLPITPKLLIILGGGAVYFLLGVIDDRVILPAKLKFFIEIAVALAVIVLGIKYGFILSNPFGKLGGQGFLVLLSIPFYVVWIVGIANAVNLIDGLDGLASGVILIACLTLIVAALVNPVVSLSPLLLITLGVLVAYIPYNLYPAKTIMGDNGSLFLGYMLAVISLASFVKADHSIFLSILPPAMALFIPIFDTILAILRRSLNGRKIFSPDKNHVHHHLMDTGFSHPRAVYVIWFLSFCFGMVAVALSYLIEKQVFIALTISVIAFTWALLTAVNRGMLNFPPEPQSAPIALDSAAASSKK